MVCVWLSMQRGGASVGICELLILPSQLDREDAAIRAGSRPPSAAADGSCVRQGRPLRDNDIPKYR